MIMFHEPAYSDVTTNYYKNGKNTYLSMSSTVVITLCNAESLSENEDDLLQINYRVDGKSELFMFEKHNY